MLICTVSGINDRNGCHLTGISGASFHGVAYYDQVTVIEDGLLSAKVNAKSGPSIVIECFSATDAHKPQIFLAKSSSDVMDTVATTVDGELLGDIAFVGVNSGTPTAVIAAQITGVQDGSSGATVCPAALHFTVLSSGGTKVTINRADGSWEFPGSILGASIAGELIDSGTIPDARLNHSFKTGTYVGDAATTRNITGIGFNPTAVMVIPLDSKDVTMKTSGMSSTNAKNVTTGNINTDAITALITDGFTVGDGSTGTNNTASGITYSYVAQK